MARRHEDRRTTIVRFYQIANTSLDKVVARIATKAFERDMRVCIVVEQFEQQKKLDDFLWVFPKGGFLPHGLCNRPDSEVQKDPVLICDKPTDVNGAVVVLMTNGVTVENPEQFEMIVDFVKARSADSVDERHKERQRYRHYRDMGCKMEYWIQGPQGWKESGMGKVQSDGALS